MGRPRTHHVDDAQVETLVREGLSQHEIAARLGVSRAAVNRSAARLRKAGVVLLTTRCRAARGRAVTARLRSIARRAADPGDGMVDYIRHLRARLSALETEMGLDYSADADSPYVLMHALDDTWLVVPAQAIGEYRTARAAAVARGDTDLSIVAELHALTVRLWDQTPGPRPGAVSLWPQAVAKGKRVPRARSWSLVRGRLHGNPDIHLEATFGPRRRILLPVHAVRPGGECAPRELRDPDEIRDEFFRLRCHVEDVMRDLKLRRARAVRALAVIALRAPDRAAVERRAIARLRDAADRVIEADAARYAAAQRYADAMPPAAPIDPAIWRAAGWVQIDALWADGGADDADHTPDDSAAVAIEAAGLASADRALAAVADSLAQGGSSGRTASARRDGFLTALVGD